MSYMSRNPQVASVVLDDITTTTPGNPPAGKHKIVDRMGNIFVRNSSGAETIIASAAGNSDGEKNYITNPSGAASISGWENVGDLDIVRTATAAELPREFSTKTGLKITADANAQTVADYVYYDFTLDDVDAAGRIMKLKWDQKITGTYLAGELAVVITTQADRTTAVVTPFTTAIPAQDGTFETYFLAPATATASLVIRCTGEMATDGGIVISDVVVGPNVQVQGSAIGAWEPKTFTLTNIGNATVVGYVSTAGEAARFRGRVTIGSSLPTSNLVINFPAGYTANMAKTNNFWGTCLAVVGAAIHTGVAIWASDASFSIYGDDGGGIWGVSTPVTFANGDIVDFDVTVPVNELSSNVTLANRALEEFGATSDTWDGAGSTTIYGPAGQTIGGALTTSRAKTITWQQAVQSTDTIKVEFATTAYPNNWTDASNVVSLALDSTGDATKSAGFTVASGSATTTVVTFNRYKTLANDDAPAVDWANTMMWRVRKVSGGASVGYPISSANIVGRTDGVAPASGMVGEYGETTGSTTALTTSQFSDGGNSGKVLTAGVWEVWATCVFATDAGTRVGTYSVSVGTQSGNSSTGIDVNRNSTVNSGPYGVLTLTSLRIASPKWRVTVPVGSTTTYYPKAFAMFDTANMSANCYLFWSRIA